MKKLHLMIAALICHGAPLAMANTTPVIKLDKVAKTSFGPHLDSFNAYSFNIQGTPKRREFGNTKAGGTDFTHILFGGFPKEAKGGGRAPIDAVHDAGPFSFYADAGIYKPFVGGYAASKTDISYYCEIAPVTPVPEPETWALMLLGVGLLVYQGRRRKSKGAAWSAK